MTSSDDGPGSGMGGRRPRDGGPGDVARALVEAALSGDFEAARSYCAPDITLTLEGIQTVSGHEGLRQLLEFNAEIATDVVIEIHHVLGSDDTAALNRTTHLTVGGKRLRVEVGSFFTLRDGLVADWTDYQDMQNVWRALGH
ncbi:MULTISPECIES: nuclear transport factor 2 family protein [unclassified Dietzia]|uniref:nuclear transport factor 2 family protein n=1 Tax=unclassified Dietzia TaxID=2617939 RepID=UPI0020A2512B|nr:MULTISPECIES: nuclear transport factor 2 family protein [unclassified Dietzia]